MWYFINIIIKFHLETQVHYESKTLSRVRVRDGERHEALAHDARVVRARRQLLAEVAALREADCKRVGIVQL